MGKDKGKAHLFVFINYSTFHFAKGGDGVAVIEAGRFLKAITNFYFSDRVLYIQLIRNGGLMFFLPKSLAIWSSIKIDCEKRCEIHSLLRGER